MESSLLIHSYWLNNACTSVAYTRCFARTVSVGRHAWLAIRHAAQRAIRCVAALVCRFVLSRGDRKRKVPGSVMVSCTCSTCVAVNLGYLAGWSGWPSASVIQALLVCGNVAQYARVSGGMAA